jgi:hypothetical protein
MCLASFTYHFEFLEAHLHTDCAVRYSAFFSELVPHGNCVRVAFPWDRSKDTPEITGIPPHTILLSEITQLKGMVTVLRAQIRGDLQDVLGDELDKREIGGAGFVQSEKILGKIDELLAEKTNRQVRDSTVSNNDEWIANLNSNIEEGLNGTDEDNFRNDEEEVQELSASLQAHIEREKTKKQLSMRKLTCGFHHGLFNPLPSTWQFPFSLPIIHIITLWLIGNIADNIPPFRCITNANVKHIKNGKEKVFKTKKVMMEIERIARIEGVWIENANAWDGGKVNCLWSTVWKPMDKYLSLKLGSERSRKGQVSYRSVYNKMVSSGLFKKQLTN